MLLIIDYMITLTVSVIIIYYPGSIDFTLNKKDIFPPKA